MRKNIYVCIIALTIGLTLIACESQQAQYSPTATNTFAPSYTPAVPRPVEPSITPQATEMSESATEFPTLATPTWIAPSVPFPLSEPGPYYTGKRVFTFNDANRNGREVGVTVWYPSVLPEGSADTRLFSGNNRDPDFRGAPYSLILSSSKAGSVFATHLASHGFVYVGVNGQDSSDHWGDWIIDYPLDIIFVLNQIASNPLMGLENMIDTNHAGAMGYSFDGYTSLALSGARVDPEFYASQCENATTINPAPPAWWIDYICNPTGGWDELVRNAGSTITDSNDGLWKAMKDERIRAVMPMAPEGAWLFGERGLAAVDRPTLIIGATADDINFYGLEATYIFEHIPVPNQSMISFVGKGHMMIFDADPVAYMKHFATAFFSYWLQGQEGYIKYFSEDFVAQHEDLVWGVYEK